jgi:hypothetical protein
LPIRIRGAGANTHWQSGVVKSRPVWTGVPTPWNGSATETGSARSGAADFRGSSRILPRCCARAISPRINADGAIPFPGHPERSEGSRVRYVEHAPRPGRKIPRCARDDRVSEGAASSALSSSSPTTSSIRVHPRSSAAETPSAERRASSRPAQLPLAVRVPLVDAADVGHAHRVAAGDGRAAKANLRVWRELTSPPARFLEWLRERRQTARRLLAPRA